MRFAFGDTTGEGFVQTVNLVFVCPILVHYALVKREFFLVSRFLSIIHFSVEHLSVGKSTKILLQNSSNQFFSASRTNSWLISIKSFNIGRNKSRCPFSGNYPIIICKVLLCKDTKNDKNTQEK